MDKAKQHQKMRKAVRILRQAGSTFRIAEGENSKTFHCYICKSETKVDDITEVCPQCEFDHKKVTDTMQQTQSQPNQNMNQAVSQMIQSLTQQQGNTDRRLAVYLTIGIFIAFTIMTFVLGIFFGFFIMK